MLAARYHDTQDVRIDEIPEPEPGPGEVKIRVAYNGICGTDVHEYYSGPAWIPQGTHPRTGASRPIVIGHEFSGTVVATGAGVATVAPGDRVCVEGLYPCDECPRCLEGMPNLCTSFALHGLSGTGGGLSQFTVVKDFMVHRLPDTVSLELGALVEPMAVTTHAINRARLSPESKVLVFGAGPIGIGTFLGLRARGVTSVLVVEPSAERRAGIQALGATDVVDPTAVDLASAVSGFTGGAGADVAFDCAGVAASFRSACESVRARGQVVVVATYEKEPPFPGNTVLLGEVEILGCLAYSGPDFDDTIAIMAAGGYDITGWVAHIPLDGLLDDGIRTLREGRGLKILVDLPGGDPDRA
ncbi:2,3-butanediol dehydrogenase [Herbiconiux moechotypicola]|uniref:2,3-butanediol dehydrogenase n=1 Tax=Herbiconiux moechotypicola TaxID=637393 RepID=A0ABN3DL95_9MICO|nr:2,3-butanediol dehydrogenase [Herbiconiux moechotypicola]MCS5730137.1 2,3-butanediol dehydrogenase [Herbiconiux moechotypicola]